LFFLIDTDTPAIYSLALPDALPILLYRHNFGDGPRGLSLGLSVGYSRLSFVIDKAAAPEGVIVDVPNVVYSYLDPGASVRIPVRSEEHTSELQSREKLVCRHMLEKK